MSIFDAIKSCEMTNAHGEVNFLRIIDGKPELVGFVTVGAEKGIFVVGHSESGHDHILEADGVTMMERISDGMKILYAIVEKPVVLKQKAGSPHKDQVVQPGNYIITNNQEYDPFLEQARRVAD